ncbi:hypothetical protein F4556_000733 [Kitasatospora gansuensis]|uniref:Gram-positive cocci surface proteins LPxTG domain-containing protein n=1 Tax=Kitasatospora gansuensis TaxID=258050 RepID=A0A7W7S795_9ACTN|nr:hypothetical protein [Kitasatospora gansuensis]MBB4945198.1 hypothetical protein [Kitasatospora gansuensis]
MLTAGLSVLPADSAWACGDETSAPPIADSLDARHATDPTLTFLAPLPTTITRGGPPVEIDIELYNGTGSAYRHFAPSFALFNRYAGEFNPEANLRPEYLVVEVMDKGQWRNLTLARGCDPTVWANTAVVGAPFGDSLKRRMQFRVTLKADASKYLEQLQVFSVEKLHYLKVIHPDAPVTSTPGATASPSPSPSTAPAALKQGTPTATPSPVATPTPAAVTVTERPTAAVTELAETGSSTPNTFLLVSAAGFVAFGTIVLLAVRRSSRR